MLKIRLKFQSVPTPRAAWNYGGVVAGYVKRFQKNSATIDLMTVKVRQSLSSDVKGLLDSS